jgi:hypothetical protein
MVGELAVPLVDRCAEPHARSRMVPPLSATPRPWAARVIQSVSRSTWNEQASVPASTKSTELRDAGESQRSATSSQAVAVALVITSPGVHHFVVIHRRG